MFRLTLQAGKGAPYYVGAAQTLPRGMYSDRNKNIIGKFRATDAPPKALIFSRQYSFIRWLRFCSAAVEFRNYRRRFGVEAAEDVAAACSARSVPHPLSNPVKRRDREDFPNAIFSSVEADKRRVTAWPDESTLKWKYLPFGSDEKEMRTVLAAIDFPFLSHTSARCSAGARVREKNGSISWEKFLVPRHRETLLPHFNKLSKCRYLYR